MIGRNRVVITGIGVLAANGIGKEAFWNSLLAGKSGIGPITLFDASDLSCRIAGEVKDFNPLEYIDAIHKPKRMGRFSQLAFAATNLAIEDACLTGDALRTFDPVPVVMGVSTSDVGILLERPKAYSTSSLIPHAPAASAAAIFGLNCEIMTLSNACTSGIDAIAHAVSLLERGKADIALAGGTDSSITRKSMEFLIQGNMLPTKMNDSPGEASRPFDLHRDGGLLAEGSCILVLETTESAMERGAHVYAEILGYGTRTDFSTSRAEAALSRAMQMALSNSRLQSKQIDYINAHAPSDPFVDLMETNAIKATFKQIAHTIPVGSIKGAIGNPLGAGGSIQCASTALAISNKCLPATVNHKTLDPHCDLDYISEGPRHQNIEHAMVNSRGVSGNTSSLILKAYH